MVAHCDFHRWAAPQPPESPAFAQKRPAEDRGRKNHWPKPFSSLEHGLGRNLRLRKGAAGLHQKKCHGTLGVAALRPRCICASTRLGFGAFSQLDNRRLRRAVSLLLGQGCLTAHSPDLNPSMWTILEEQVSATRYATARKLKTASTRPTTLRRNSFSFSSRPLGCLPLLSVFVFFLSFSYIIALECKPANSQQKNFTGQTKNKQNLIFLLSKETIFHIFVYYLRS